MKQIGRWAVLGCHVAGEYSLDKDDEVNGAVPPDSVFVCSSLIDMHGGGARLRGRRDAARARRGAPRLHAPRPEGFSPYLTP